MNTIIQTSPARCQDCYRCVRECPLKSIALSGGQAQIVDAQCVLCGSCVKACPQGAKQIKDDFSKFLSCLNKGEQIIVSVAPSVACGVDALTPKQVFQLLKEMGVFAVRQVAEGANQVARAYRQLYEKNSKTVISSCCPAVVSLVEKHFPKLIPNLAPIESPMVTHSRMLKEVYPTAKIFFLGPCAAKIQEVRDLDDPNLLEGAITFQSLADFLGGKEVPSVASDPLGIAKGGLFPMTGGVLEAARLEGESGAVQISGLENLLELFRFLEAGGTGPRFVEAMACRGGCLMGPAMASEDNLWQRRERVATWIGKEAQIPERTPLSRGYLNRWEEEPEFTEDQIKAVLARIGKFTPEDETNCGGCGYSTCREKAVAVLKGQAETEMCVSYMKEKFRSFASLVVRATPDGVIVVDRDLIIQEFNPTAERWFNRHGKDVRGSKLSAFIAPEHFAQVVATGEQLHLERMSYPEYKLTVEELILPLPEYELVVGIFRDLSAQLEAEAELDLLSEETIDKATRVIDEHLHTAQEIAGLLAENAAQTKATLWEVISLINKRKAE